MKILLKIKYDGTEFFGYQVQREHRTVQGELNRVSARLFGVDCNITGCSRTDSGVHALSFYATVEPKSAAVGNIPISNIPRAYNSLLSDDVCVVAAFEVGDDFHPRYDVISKEYTYLLHNSQTRDPFLKNKALHLPKTISEEQISRMNQAAAHLCGEHDFVSFMSEGSNVQSTLRRIDYAFVENAGEVDDGSMLAFRICGNGFLYNMVRIIVGTLLEVAYEKIQPDDIVKIINAKDRSAAAQTAPAHGLYLSKVTYQDQTLK